MAGPLTPRTDINPAVMYGQAFSLYPDLPGDIKNELLADPPRLPAADAQEALKKFDPMGWHGLLLQLSSPLGLTPRRLTAQHPPVC